VAGLIQALFGGRSRPPETDPLPGQGGYDMPPGPAGQTGYPGSTGSTRTFSPRNLRAAKLPARGNINADLIRQELQSTPATNKGGPTDGTVPGNETAGGHPLGRQGGHSVIDTTTPYSQAQSQIGVGTPGAQNVRNQVAQDYKARPGQVRTYMSAPRADQAQLAPSEGGAGIGAISVPVQVQSRFVFEDGGNQTWHVLRRMPYTGRGDGARGAVLNGNRYYASGQADQFADGRMGDFGIARRLGGKRPVSFTQPGPWTSDFYDTTQDVQDGSAGQSPDAIYVSPVPARPNSAAGRAGN
jgi:hypothetical protein